MTWSYVSRVNGSNFGTFTPSSWPSGVQQGDLVLFAAMVAPDGGSGSGNDYSCSTAGWNLQSSYGAGGYRFMWTIYSPAQALPTLTQGSSVSTITWNLLAFRSTRQSGFGRAFGPVFGSPPTGSSYTTVADSTLLVLYATQPGDQSVGWTAEGGFTQIFQTNGSGTGNPNSPNQWCGWQSASSRGSVISGMRAYLNSNRYYILAFGESSGFTFSFAS